MKAVGLTRHLPISHPESLLDLELPRPVPAARDVLIDVRAVSVNPADAWLRARESPALDGPQVLGWDVAGVVVEVGPQASLFRPGDEVYATGDVTRPGGNSQLFLADERIVGRKPRRLDFGEAAALPLTAVTAHEALFDRLRVARGEASKGKRLLIVGGAGGVGSIAIQLARALTGLQVMATASRSETDRWVRDLGAHAVVNHRQPLGPQLAALGWPHADYVLCTAATDPYFAALGELVAPQGALCFLVPTEKPVDLGPLFHRSVTVTWEFMFTRSMFATADMGEQGRVLDELADLVDAGRIRTTVTRRLGPICARTLREAHTQIESGTTIGKLVLEGWE
jgi:NADPH:quinone reductase